MFKKKEVYVNKKKNKPNYIIVMILSIIISVVWTSNFYEYKELRKDYNRTITIYNTAVEHRLDREEKRDAGVVDAAKEVTTDGEEITELDTPLPVSVEDKVKQTFKEDAQIALAIMQAESKGKPDAINAANNNGSIDRGLFQINSIHQETNLFDVDKNIAVAYKIFKRDGWTAWSTYNNGNYLNHL